MLKRISDFLFLNLGLPTTRAQEQSIDRQIELKFALKRKKAQVARRQGRHFV